MTKDNPKAKPKRARRIQKAEERTSAQHCPGSYGYVKLQLVSATFVQLRQLPCHFDKIVTSDSNIAYIRDMINEHCGETLNNIIVFEGELLAGDVRQVLRKTMNVPSMSASHKVSRPAKARYRTRLRFAILAFERCQASKKLKVPKRTRCSTITRWTRT
eukprot:TRINITY_DN7300_c0_g1_i4.p1 TRINITY_DN7300_c0_g1~~TRINITY_DN7300_c0_g1_i4.p1  ORF type:complete len:159 (+),score=16.05 TRINITY_DN7300_c0_g1_i4:119-595(+)